MVLVKAVVLLFPLLFQVQFKHNLPKTRPSQGNEIDAKHALDKRIGSSHGRTRSGRTRVGSVEVFPNDFQSFNGTIQQVHKQVHRLNPQDG